MFKQSIKKILPRSAGQQVGTGTPAILVNGAPGQTLPAILVNGVPGQTQPTVQANGVPGKPTAADPAIGDPRWHSRGYLPHFDSPGAIQHVTFHLSDSVAKDAIRKLESEIHFLPEAQRDAERRKRLEAWTDAGHGSCVLRDSMLAGMMQSSFLNFEIRRYHLLAWVVMPNHVHALIEPINEWTVAKIVATWKKFTARQINEHLKARGQVALHPLWHREYWDRFMRDERHFRQTIAYIHDNPVKAGLVPRPEDWRWSSAYPGNANHQIGSSPNSGSAEHRFGKNQG